MGLNLATLLAGEGVTVNTVSQCLGSIGHHVNESLDPPCNDWRNRYDPNTKVYVRIYIALGRLSY